MNKKGLLCSVFKDDCGNCSNGGLSSKHKKVILIGDDVPEIFEPNNDTPAVYLVKRNIGYTGEYLHCQPDDNLDSNYTPFMFGGTFVYTPDSRFPNSYPIPLHDRKEIWEDYKTLST